MLSTVAIFDVGQKQYLKVGHERIDLASPAQKTANGSNLFAPIYEQFLVLDLF